jgi:outer membrane lipoprotein LolB
MLPAIFRHFSLACVLLLAGCSALQPKAPPTTASPEQYRQHQASLQAVEQFEIHGRIGVQTNPRGFSGSLQWQHEAAHDEIMLFSPLGSQVAEISASPDGVTLLTSDGEKYQAADAAALTQKTLGWSLPLRGLTDWVTGRPAAGPVEDVHWDAAGRITVLRQFGWNIEYIEYTAADGLQLPSRINMKSPQLNLKLIIERWHLTPGSIISPTAQE